MFSCHVDFVVTSQYFHYRDRLAYIENNTCYLSTGPMIRQVHDSTKLMFHHGTFTVHGEQMSEQSLFLRGKEIGTNGVSQRCT